MEDDNDDFEISNAVLVNHLPEINKDISQPTERAVPSEPALSNEKTERKQATVNSLAWYFVRRLVEETISISSSSALQNHDRNQILEHYINTKVEHIRQKQAKHWFFIFGICCLISALAFSHLLFLLLLFLIFLGLFLAKFLLRCLLAKADDCLALLSQLLYYMKELELTSLASQRRLVIELKQKQHGDDTLNYPFRRIVFHLFRAYFYHFQEHSRRVLRSDILEANTLICTMKKEEMSVILDRDLDDSALELMTDRFSLSCLRSHNKLNRLLVSEHLKLIFFAYFGLVQSRLVPLSVFMVNWHVIKSIFLFNRFYCDIKSALNTCKLVDNNEQWIPKQRATEPSSRHLSTHLRNALLHSYEYSSGDDQAKQLAAIVELQNDLDICDLYLKQLVSHFESKHGSQRIRRQEEDISHVVASKDAAEQKKEQQPPHVHQDQSEQDLLDEVYEADTYNQSNEEVASVSPDITSELLEERENALLGKNLFYELKFALKTKQNEWSQRERFARRNVPPSQIASVDEIIMTSSHLLENDTLKYKAEIRRRRRNAKASTTFEEEKPKVNKYLQQHLLELDEDNNDKDVQPVGKHSDFIAEFMKKRQVLCNENDADDGNDEIIYE